MKCDKCGYVTHPGDQVCINCGAKLSLAHSIIPEDNLGIRKKEEEKTLNEKDYRFLIVCILGVVIVILLVVAILLLLFKR